MNAIRQLIGREILDSRGRPTVEATCILEDGAWASASVPSGASTGSAEALELRDRDPHRYGGLGCIAAARNVSGEVNDATRGRTFTSQVEFDSFLISLDGTLNKSRLGANAILAASLAFARAEARSSGMPLWSYFAQIVGREPQTLPRLTINLFSGGKHAGEQVPIQDVLIVPASVATIGESLAVAYDVYQAAAQRVFERYGMRLLRADEGGQAPPCRSAEEMIELALEAIARSGYISGRDIALAIDVAATHFYSNGVYRLGPEELSSSEMTERICRWVTDYPIVSVEDGLAEEDWEMWPKLLAAIEEKALVVGDDLLCTRQERIKRAIDCNACNALLLKINQVGTITEAADAMQLARAANWQITLSVRSGETEDHWAADLAVGWSADHFKNGSITQSERLAKYNRLLKIEERIRLPLVPWPYPAAATSDEQAANTPSKLV